MIRRTGIIIALAVTVATLALAGCSGGDSDEATSGAEAASAVAVATETPKVSALEEAQQRGVEITSATGSDENLAPEFTGLTMWLNSPPLTMTELQGQGEVVLVDFWTYT